MIAKSTNVSPFSFALLNITLVLFFLAVFVFIALVFHGEVERAKQDQELRVVLADHVTEQRGRNLATELGRLPWAEAATYVSKEEAMRNETADAGQDFLEAMGGVNPFPALIRIRLQAAQTNADSVRTLSRRLQTNDEVKEVYYPLLNIDKVNARAEMLTYIALGVGVLLLGLVFLLIRNTVKLAIHSRRMVIRSMQLVGATEAFIRKPYLRLGTLQGLVGAGLALLLLVGIVFVLNYILNTMGSTDFVYVLATPEMQVFCGVLLIFGAVAGYFSSRSAVNSFLNKHPDALR
jgi:cell division transport system permease protein